MIHSTVTRAVVLIAAILCVSGCKRITTPYGGRPETVKALTVDPYVPVRYDHVFNMNQPVTAKPRVP